MPLSPSKLLLSIEDMDPM